VEIQVLKRQGKSIRAIRRTRCASLSGPAAKRTILSRAVLDLPTQAGGQEELLRTAQVQLRDQRGRYEIVDFPDKFTRLNGVQGFVHHRPSLKRSLGYGFLRD
jgi:hypothetical protein